MRSRISPTPRTIIRTSRWDTTTAACSSRRTPSRGCARTTSSARRRSTSCRSAERRRRSRRRLPRYLGQLAAETEGAGDEEALDLVGPVHQSEAALGNTRQRADAVGEITVEAVDGERDRLDLAFAPALVAAQHALSARIFAHAKRRADQLTKRRGIQ